MNCFTTKSLDYQPLPLTGPLRRSSNYSLDRLRKTLKSEDLSAQVSQVYYYVMTTVQNRDGILQHCGSGPNWQGGVITLCTCKHYMRTSHRPDDWCGKWVAGFSGVGAVNRKNVLMYLMRVESAFEPHWDLWQALPPQVRSTKSANTNPVGDVYKPVGKETQKDPYNICKYHQPHQSHGRKYDWPMDINYQQNNCKNNNCKRAALLVGDKKYSFVWNQCIIIFDPNKSRIRRGHRTDKLENLLLNLRECNEKINR